MHTLPYAREGRVEIRKDEFTTVNRPTMKIKRTSQQKKNGTKQPRFPLMDDQDKLSSLSSKLLA